MEAVLLENLIKWSGGKAADDFKNIMISGVSTDSRSVGEGELFIPLVGEKFDGHNYIETAVNKGASAYLTEREDLLFEGALPIMVEDTEKAYQRIAGGYLEEHRVPVVGITGSNGKTSAKDIIAHILGEKFNVLATEKNFNNEVGVPKTVLGLDASKEALVVEMAMRGEGQIRELAEIVRPDVALITNVGESHFELLGSYEAIARAKCEILEFIRPGGCAVLNADNRWYDFCRERAGEDFITFGIEKEADVSLHSKESLGLDGFRIEIRAEGEIHRADVPLLGVHNIYNVLAASAVAHKMGMEWDEICKGIETLKPSDKRMVVRKTEKGWTVLNDTYNASPSSTGRALEILRDLPREGRKIAVLGDMLELGEIAVQSHRNTGKTLHESKIDYLFGIGNLGKEIVNGAQDAGMNHGKAQWFDSREELKSELDSLLKKGDVVLFKGSRLMKMEEFVEYVSGDTR